MSSVTKTALVRPEWASVPLRLDPAHCAERQTLEMLDGEEVVRYRVDYRGAVLRRRLGQCQMPVSIALPPKAFRGVAARALDDGAGKVTVTLELHHEDEKLSVPLLVASDLYDVAADWRSWAELFDLPMLMVESDGSVVPLEETLGRVRKGLPAERRSNGHRGRRPRFLARRKPGGLGVRLAVAGEEIIARN